MSYISKRLIAMDLDGTITQHKSALSEECRNVLEELSLHYRLLMVCAGGCERVNNQMGMFPIDIIGFYGMQLSTVIDGGFTIIDNHSIDADKDSVLSRTDVIRSEFGFSDYVGDSIEFHSSGMITFPILGTKADLSKKLAYDPDRVIRRKYHNRVQEIFDDYTVFIGGTSSFDIVPRPFSKLYAIDDYLSTAGLTRDDVVYFGDDYGIGGNDRDIYMSNIEFICIDNYQDFTKIAKSLLI